MQTILKAFVGLVVALAILYIAFPADQEIIFVLARGDTPLYDPATVAGEANMQPRVVGLLRAGERLSVSGCNPCKSDIDVEATYQGEKVVVGGNSFKLQRREAKAGEASAISSCLGLL